MLSFNFVYAYFLPKYKATKEGTVMGVAVSKISMLTHCQALTQACNYCEGLSALCKLHILNWWLHISSLMVFVFCVLGETLVNVLDCKKDMGLWHGVLAVRLNSTIYTVYVDQLTFFKSLVWSTVRQQQYAYLFLAECHEQNPHHRSAVCCHESLSHVLGAEGPCSQRFSQYLILISYSLFAAFNYFIACTIVC